MKYGKKDNEIAARLRINSAEFLDSLAWKEIRRAVVKQYGRRCMKCGNTPKKPWNTHVDHIKPRRYFPELSLCFDNLQVLCSRCNWRKGNKIADYRFTLGRTMEQ